MPNNFLKKTRYFLECVLFLNHITCGEITFYEDVRIVLFYYTFTLKGYKIIYTFRTTHVTRILRPVTGIRGNRTP